MLIKKNRVNGDEIIELDCTKLKNKLEKYKKYIEVIELIYDTDEIKLINFFDDDKLIHKIEPNELI